MDINTAAGLLIPFLGTTLGAACVFFMKKEMNDIVQRALTGFAAGVMVAASIWSLLIPAIEQSEGICLCSCRNRVLAWSIIPADAGSCDSSSTSKQPGGRRT